MRPLLRSYGVISTLTRSPASTRIRFLRILPLVWARIECSLSNFTRNMALGRSSITVPLNSIISSFDIRPHETVLLGREHDIRQMQGQGIQSQATDAALPTTHHIGSPSG